MLLHSCPVQIVKERVNLGQTQVLLQSPNPLLVTLTALYFYVLFFPRFHLFFFFSSYSFFFLFIFLPIWISLSILPFSQTPIFVFSHFQSIVTSIAKVLLSLSYLFIFFLCFYFLVKFSHYL